MSAIRGHDATCCAWWPTVSCASPSRAGVHVQRPSASSRACAWIARQREKLAARPCATDGASGMPCGGAACGRRSRPRRCPAGKRGRRRGCARADRGLAHRVAAAICVRRCRGGCGRSPRWSFPWRLRELAARATVSTSRASLSVISDTMGVVRARGRDQPQLAPRPDARRGARLRAVARVDAHPRGQPFAKVLAQVMRVCPSYLDARAVVATRRTFAVGPAARDQRRP